MLSLCASLSSTKILYISGFDRVGQERMPLLRVVVFSPAKNSFGFGCKNLVTFFLVFIAVECLFDKLSMLTY